MDDTHPAEPIVTTIVILGIIPGVFLCCLCILCVTRYRQRTQRNANSSLAGSMVLHFITPELHDTPCQSRGVCCICSDYAANVVFEPCKHDLFCARCAVIVWMTSRSCPLCRAPIGSILHGGVPIGLTAEDGTLLSHAIGDIVHHA